MGETRGMQKMNFTGAGQQSITVDSDESINLFQFDIAVNADTNFSIKIGTEEILSGNIKQNVTPAQFFTYGFGLGRGTGEKGDALTVQLGAAGVVYVTFIKTKD